MFVEKRQARMKLPGLLSNQPSSAQPSPPLTRDMVAIILNPHLVQAFLGGRVSHSDGAILVVGDVGPGSLPRGHPHLPCQADPVMWGTPVLPSTTPMLSPLHSCVVVLPPQSLGTGMEQWINLELGDRRLESEFQLCPTFFLHELG